MKTLSFFLYPLFICLTLSSCNKNESAPAITDQQFSVLENSPAGTFVGAVDALDEDGSQFITFEITDGNIDGSFEIEAEGGIISIAESYALDYEEEMKHVIEITVSDNHEKEPLESSASIEINVIDENEFTPEIEIQSFFIDENPVIGQEIGIVLASDEDTRQSLEFQIVKAYDEEYFQIDPNSGVLTVKNSTGFDFELDTQLNILVAVQDSHTEPREDSAIISVNVRNVQEVTDGLVAYYPFNANAQDESGNELHGTVSGASPAPDRYGIANSALSFDGTDDFVVLGDDFDVPEKSVSFWFKVFSLPVYDPEIDPYNSWHSLIVTNHPGMQFGGYHVAVSNIDGIDKIFAWKVNMAPAFDPDNLSVPIERSRWHHVSVLLSTGSLKLYVDGHLAGYYESDVTISSQYGDPNAIIGGGRHRENRFLDGAIDELYIHNRILNESEIAGLANSK